MNIIFENQKIKELQNLLQDIYNNMLVPARTAFANSIAAIDPEVSGIGNVAQLIYDVGYEFDAIEGAFFSNLSFLEVLIDKYDGVENNNQRAFERLMADLALYAGEPEPGEYIPDIDVMVNRTLRYLFDNLVQGYEEQLAPVSLKEYVQHRDEDYLASGDSERDIISKYLTKLDFNFLSSLSQVYDFFDFGELNLLVLNHMRDTSKLNPVRLDEESLQTVKLSQQRRFPELHEILADSSDNELYDVTPTAKAITEKKNTAPDDDTAMSDITAAAKMVTEKLNAGVDGDTPLSGITAAAKAVTKTQSAGVDGDTPLNDITAAAKAVTETQSAGVDGDTPLSGITAAAKTVTEELNAGSDGDTPLSGITVAAKTATEKPNAGSDGDTPLSGIMAVAKTVTEKLNAGVDGDTPLSGITAAAKAVTEELNAGVDGDAPLSDITAAAKAVTETQSTGVDDDTTLSGITAAARTVMEKLNAGVDGDTPLSGITAAAKTVTEKLNAGSDGDTTLSDIAAAAKTVTEELNAGSDGDTTLSDITAAAKAVTEKLNTGVDGDTPLSDISITEPELTEKIDADSSGDGGLDGFRTSDISGSTDFNLRGYWGGLMRRFRETAGFRFVEDDTEDRTDSINVNLAVKAARETVKEEDGNRAFQDPFNPKGTRTITPPEFIEGIADELQLLEVAIRKQLDWTEEEFHAFLDFLYTLAHSVEFPSAPVMIVMVFAAIIDYIVQSAFHKAEGVQSVGDTPEDDPLLLRQRDSEKAITAKAIQSAAAHALLDSIKNVEIASALAGMSYPETSISVSDIFADVEEIFRSSCDRFEELSGASVPGSFGEIDNPELISVYSENARSERLDQTIRHIATVAATEAVLSSFVGVTPQQLVTIHSVIPGFTTYKAPSTAESNLTSEPENINNSKNQLRPAKAVMSVSGKDTSFDDDVYSVAGVPPRNTAEDFVVEYDSSDDELSEYVIDVAGGSTMGFLGGLLLSGDEDLDDKFFRLSSLPAHTFEDIIKNAYQSGIFQQAKSLADTGDIFRVLSGGKAIMTTLDNVGSCLIG